MGVVPRAPCEAALCARVCVWAQSMSACACPALCVTKYFAPSGGFPPAAWHALCYSTIHANNSAEGAPLVGTILSEARTVPSIEHGVSHFPCQKSSGDMLSLCPAGRVCPYRHRAGGGGAGCGCVSFDTNGLNLMRGNSLGDSFEKGPRIAQERGDPRT